MPIPLFLSAIRCQPWVGTLGTCTRARTRTLSPENLFNRHVYVLPLFALPQAGTRELSAYLARREKVEEMLKRLLLGVKRLQFGAHVCLAPVENERGNVCNRLRSSNSDGRSEGTILELRAVVLRSIKYVTPSVEGTWVLIFGDERHSLCTSTRESASALLLLGF